MEAYSDYGITIPNGQMAGEVETTCPKCSKDRKKNNLKCLGINLDKSVWNCRHCGWAGYLKKGTAIPTITYTKPNFKNNTTLSTKAVKWFSTRSISQKTLVDMKVTEGKSWMPQANKEVNTIQFQYFKGEDLINTKYRDGKKNFKLHKGAERIFYNYDVILESPELYIVEGEIDCLSLIESGLKNVISVPNGANTKTNNLAYLDSCIKLFKDKRIHLALDNDLPGRKLRDDLANRFGKENCDYIEFGDFKDANDCLSEKGIQGVIDYCTHPKHFPLEGAFTISDIIPEIQDMYDNGLDKGADLQIPNFNLNIVKGYLTMVTGIPSHGKSDFVDYMALSLRHHEDWKGAFYSPENKPTQLHFSKLARKLIGKHWDGPSRITHPEVITAINYLNDYFYFIKPEKGYTLDSILKYIRQLQLRHGLDFFVIDAWNKLDHLGDDSSYIGKSLDKIAAFCEDYNLHCFLVAHPKKMRKNENGTYEVPTLYDIKGASEFYDKADNGICIYRDFEKKQTEVHVQKIKFDHWGTEGMSTYSYDVTSKRYYVGHPNNDPWITNEKTE